MRRRRTGPRLSEHQQVIIAVALMILLAASLLYCLGFASVALRQVWEGAEPRLSPAPSEQDLQLTPAPDVTPTLPPAATPF